MTETIHTEDPLVLRAEKVWDDLAAAAMARPTMEGRAIDREAIVERCAAELAELDATRRLEIEALQATIEDLQRKVPATPRPTGTPEQWAVRVAFQGRPAHGDVTRWRSDALRRLAAIGITAADITIVRLADALLQPASVAKPDEA